MTPHHTLPVPGGCARPPPSHVEEADTGPRKRRPPLVGDGRLMVQEPNRKGYSPLVSMLHELEHVHVRAVLVAVGEVFAGDLAVIAVDAERDGGAVERFRGE